MLADRHQRGPRLAHRDFVETNGFKSDEQRAVLRVEFHAFRLRFLEGCFTTRRPRVGRTCIVHQIEGRIEQQRPFGLVCQSSLRSDRDLQLPDQAAFTLRDEDVRAARSLHHGETVNGVLIVDRIVVPTLHQT